MSEHKEEDRQQKKGISKKESLAILAASMLAALSAFLVTVIAKHNLESLDNSQFLIFWSLLFGVYGVVAGLQQESTRAVGAARLQTRLTDAGLGRPGAPVIAIAAAFGLVIGLLVLLTSPWWAPGQFHSQVYFSAALIGCSVPLYAVHAAMSGAAAGREKWYQFALLGGAEASWRLLAILLAALFAVGLAGFQLAVVSAVFFWMVLLLCSRQARITFTARADVGSARLSRNILFAMGSSAASAVLMTGFPALMRASEGGQLSERASIELALMILAISICRSPIMIPLQAFQGFAISAFLKQKHRPVAAMVKPAAALMGLGLLGALLAGLVGPWLFRLIYPPKPNEVEVYDQVLSGWLLGLLVLASAVMALLVLSGTAVIALNAHRAYVAGWTLAALVSLALLFLPLDLVSRSVLALFVGPACGFGVHLTAMLLYARRSLADPNP